MTLCNCHQCSDLPFSGKIDNLDDYCGFLENPGFTGQLVHYSNSVVLVLILSKEALKQLGSSVVTGDDPV